jgi:UDP-3-O-[3-hydroxymyristoyl] glucosamine N-acyltransferase
MFTGNTITLRSLAETLDLDVRRDAEISYVGKIPTNLPRRLVYGSKPAHLTGLTELSGIAGVVAPAELAEQVPAELGLVVSSQPAVTAIAIYEHLLSLPDFIWQSFETRVAASARIHPSAVVAPRDVIIGENTVIDANAVIRERSVIGDNCYVGPQSVIGAEALDFHPGGGRRRLLPQAGGVRMADHAMVLSGTMVVRGTFGGFTEIGEEAIVDNLVHVAHDCVIGRRVTVVACSELSGRTTIGDDSYIGPNATVSNGLALGASSYVSLGSVVVQDVEEGQRVTGNFAVPHRAWIRFVKSLVGRN